MNAHSAFSTLDEGRRDPRTHLFVAATLYSDAGSAPVHIRNISQSGALIESSGIPDPGTAVMLKRGSLRSAGRIAWRSERKAGIAFTSGIYVVDWMPRKAPSHQGRVDEIVLSLKSGGQHDGAADTVDMSGDSSVEAALRALRADLAQLGNSLVGDAILVATHPEIQTLDIALQRVDRIIGQIQGNATERSDAGA